MEFNIIKTLSFDLSHHSVLRFIERIAKLTNADDIIFTYALYLSELSIFIPEYAAKRSSILASGALYIAFKTIRKSFKWSQQLINNTGYSEQAIIDFATNLSLVLSPITASNGKIEDTLLKAKGSLLEEQMCVKKKYSHPKRYEVALIEMKQM